MSTKRKQKLTAPETNSEVTPEVEAVSSSLPPSDAALPVVESAPVAAPKKRKKAASKKKVEAVEEVAATVAPAMPEEAPGEPMEEKSVEAADGTVTEREEGSVDATAEESQIAQEPRPPAKLERLQKILAAAGVASRRSAEAMIEQGRVQVNGKVVTVLGTKADAGRDHIRVDGKLLHGAERLRYFVLNKPRGFVTTVKDPEHRPTVMQFFEKMKERLYPVGRLDYMSEGLLVVTNDGELANRLTKASSGVEKTYLVKVAGQPTEAELNILRGGVSIELGKPGSRQIRTSPARIRQVRQGDNPWYEVVLIEGRNRELRKMFEEIGHFVEKIRRVGYGPLVLDLEPGNLRELEERELESLRKAAEGKLRTPKAKEVRRRNAADAGVLPTVLPKPSSRPRPPAQPPAASRPVRPYDNNPAAKPFRQDRGGAEGFRPAAGRTSSPNPVRSFSRVEDERPRRSGPGGQSSFGTARPAGRSFDRPAYDRAGSGPARPSPTGTGRPSAGRPFAAKPAWKKPERPERGGRPEFQRPAPPRRDTRFREDDPGPVRPPNLHIEEVQPERPGPARSFPPRPFQARPSAPRSDSPRPYSDRPRPSRPGAPGRPSFERPAPSARPGPAKPFRGESGLARPYTTSSGKPRAGGPRPSSKPDRFAKSGSPKPGSFKSYRDKPTARPFAGPAQPSFRGAEGGGSFTPRPSSGSGPRPSSSSRPFTPRPERKAGPGWKPKPNFGGPGKPASGSHSRPKPGGFKSSGYKGKPAGKRSGGGKRG